MEGLSAYSKFIFVHNRMTRLPKLDGLYAGEKEIHVLAPTMMNVISYKYCAKFDLKILRHHEQKHFRSQEKNKMSALTSKEHLKCDN